MAYEKVGPRKAKPINGNKLIAGIVAGGIGAVSLPYGLERVMERVSSVVEPGQNMEYGRFLARQFVALRSRLRAQINELGGRLDLIEQDAPFFLASDIATALVEQQTAFDTLLQEIDEFMEKEASHASNARLDAKLQDFVARATAQYKVANAIATQALNSNSAPATALKRMP